MQRGELLKMTDMREVQKHVNVKRKKGKDKNQHLHTWKSTGENIYYITTNLQIQVQIPAQAVSEQPTHLFFLSIQAG